MVVPFANCSRGPQLLPSFSQMLLQWMLVIISDEYDDRLESGFACFCSAREHSAKYLAYFTPASVLATLKFPRVILDTESQ